MTFSLNSSTNIFYGDGELGPQPVVVLFAECGQLIFYRIKETEKEFHAIVPQSVSSMTPRTTPALSLRLSELNEAKAEEGKPKEKKSVTLTELVVSEEEENKMKHNESFMSTTTPKSGLMSPGGGYFTSKSELTTPKSILSCVSGSPREMEKFYGEHEDKEYLEEMSKEYHRYHDYDHPLKKPALPSIHEEENSPATVVAVGKGNGGFEELKQSSETKETNNKKLKKKEDQSFVAPETMEKDPNLPELESDPVLFIQLRLQSIQQSLKLFDDQEMTNESAVCQVIHSLQYSVEKFHEEVKEKLDNHLHFFRQTENASFAIAREILIFERIHSKEGSRQPEKQDHLLEEEILSLYSSQELDLVMERMKLKLESRFYILIEEIEKLKKLLKKKSSFMVDLKTRKDVLTNVSHNYQEFLRISDIISRLENLIPSTTATTMMTTTSSMPLEDETHLLVKNKENMSLSNQNLILSKKFWKKEINKMKVARKYEMIKNQTHPEQSEKVAAAMKKNEKNEEKLQKSKAVKFGWQTYKTKKASAAVMTKEAESKPTSSAVNVKAPPAATPAVGAPKTVESKPVLKPASSAVVGVAQPPIPAMAPKAFSFGAPKKEEEGKKLTVAASQPPIPSFAPSVFGAPKIEKKEEKSSAASQPPIPSFAPSTFSFGGAKKDEKPAASAASQPSIPSTAPSAFGFGTKKEEKAGTTVAASQPPIPSFAPSTFSFGGPKKEEKTVGAAAASQPPIPSAAPSAFGFGTKPPATMEKKEEKTTAPSQPPIPSSAPSVFGAVKPVVGKKDEKPLSASQPPIPSAAPSAFSFGVPSKKDEKSSSSSSSTTASQPPIASAAPSTFSFGAPVAAAASASKEPPTTTGVGGFSFTSNATDGKPTFGFGAPVSQSAQPPATGGFTFGGPLTTTATTTAATKSTEAGPSKDKLIQTLMKKYNLTEEDIDKDDILESIMEAEKAWEKVLGKEKTSHDIKAVFDGKDGEDDDPKLEGLLTELGTTYSAEEHGQRIRGVCEKKGGDGKQLRLTKENFVDWYIGWLYSEYDDEEDNNEGEEQEEQNKEKKEPKTSNWSNTEWKVNPKGGSGEGTWKCPVCAVNNPKEAVKCPCCDAPAPLSSAVPAAQPPVPAVAPSKFSFGAPVEAKKEEKPKSTSSSAASQPPIPAFAPSVFGGAAKAEKKEEKPTAAAFTAAPTATFGFGASKIEKSSSASQPPIPSSAPSIFGAPKPAEMKEEKSSSSASQPPIPAFAPSVFGAPKAEKKEDKSSSSSSSVQPPIPTSAPSTFSFGAPTKTTTEKKEEKLVTAAASQPPIPSSAPSVFGAVKTTVSASSASQPPIPSSAPSIFGAATKTEKKETQPVAATSSFSFTAPKTFPTTTTNTSDESFLPSETFTGAKTGYSFQRGSKGVGYYKDYSQGGGGENSSNKLTLEDLQSNNNNSSAIKPPNTLSLSGSSSVASNNLSPAAAATELSPLSKPTSLGLERKASVISEPPTTTTSTPASQTSVFGSLPAGGSLFAKKPEQTPFATTTTTASPSGSSLFGNKSGGTTTTTTTNTFGGGGMSFGGGFAMASGNNNNQSTNIFAKPANPLFSASPGAFTTKPTGAVAPPNTTTGGSSSTFSFNNNSFLSGLSQSEKTNSGSGGGGSLFGNNKPVQQQQPAPVTVAAPTFGFSSNTGASTTAFGNNNVGNNSNNNLQTIQKRVEDIYQQYNPEKLNEIPRLMEKYRGRENELIANLEKKYMGAAVSSPFSPAPTTTSNNNLVPTGIGGGSLFSFGNTTAKPATAPSFGGSSGFGQTSSLGFMGKPPTTITSATTTTATFGGGSNAPATSLFGGSGGGGAVTSGFGGFGGQQQSSSSSSAFGGGFGQGTTGSLFGNKPNNANQSNNSNNNTFGGSEFSQYRG
jgi:hypothetical protein